MEPITVAYNGYTITTDKSLMKIDDIHQWLSQEAYWCKDIPMDKVRTAFDSSFCIGALIDGRQVAYARLVTDYSAFGYLADVFVTEPHRGKGISKKMMDVLFGLDWVNGLRRIMLSTTDAHGLYRRYGFSACASPDRLMEVALPFSMYQKQQG